MPELAGSRKTIAAIGSNRNGRIVSRSGSSLLTGLRGELSRGVRVVPPSDRRRSTFRTSPFHLPIVAGPPSELADAAERQLRARSYSRHCLTTSVRSSGAIDWWRGAPLTSIQVEGCGPHLSPQGGSHRANVHRATRPAHAEPLEDRPQVALHRWAFAEASVRPRQSGLPRRHQLADERPIRGR